MGSRVKGRERGGEGSVQGQPRSQPGSVQQTQVTWGGSLPQVSVAGVGTPSLWPSWGDSAPGSVVVVSPG